jgi:hypothetical protein
VVELRNRVVYRESSACERTLNKGARKKKNAAKKTVNDLSRAIKLVRVRLLKRGYSSRRIDLPRNTRETILSPESLITLNGNAGNNFATNNGQFENGLLNRNR